MKKFLVVLFCLVLVIGLAACGDNSSSSSSDDSTSTTWPTDGPASMVPAPDFGTIDKVKIDYDYPTINMSDVTRDNYDDYNAALKADDSLVIYQEKDDMIIFHNQKEKFYCTTMYYGDSKTMQVLFGEMD